jgi:hypothetical protein
MKIRPQKNPNKEKERFRMLKFKSDANQLELENRIIIIITKQLNWFLVYMMSKGKEKRKGKLPIK